MKTEYQGVTMNISKANKLRMIKYGEMGLISLLQNMTFKY